MKSVEEKTSIPEQKQGASSDVESSVEYRDIDRAKRAYEEAKGKLLNVNKWSTLKGVSAKFQLIDSNGEQVQRSASLGDYFKIDVPAPGSITGEGHDWVQIEAINDIINDDQTEERLTMTVRPASNPLNDKKDVAHFFTPEATSSFIVKRRGTIVSAEVHGRNEKPNTDAETILDKARNTLVALGAIAGFSSNQWKNLTLGLIDKNG